MKRILFILTMALIAFVGVNNVDAMRADVVAYGTSGDCGWILYEDGDMHIGTHLSDLDNPNEPNSCMLGVADSVPNLDENTFTYFSPWIDYADQIEEISFSGVVYANNNMSYMFQNLTKLISIDMTNLRTSNTTDMSYMFSGDVLLSNIVFGNNFDTSKVTNMNAMFAMNESLNTLDLSNFNTSEVESMGIMFMDTGFETLDISNFDTSKVTNMWQMFSFSRNLKTIIIGDGFTTSNVIIGEDTSVGLFEDCTNLVGGKGTVYDSNHIDVDYAVIDSPTNPGYFTSNKIVKSISDAEVAGIKTQVYSGKVQRQDSLVVTLNGKELVKDIDYQVLYNSLVNAGTIKMTIKGIGDYEGILVKTFTRKKAKNNLTVKAYNKTVYYSKVKRAAQVVKPITIVKKQGTLTYTKLSGSSTKLLLNKTTGKVTVKKGTKKGRYKIKIKVYASGNTNYFSNYGIRTVYVTVK